MHPIDAAFEPVLGRPSWLVRRGIGSFITLEFGEPALTIGDVRHRSVTVGGTPRPVRTRLTAIQGDWHLWIYCCLWTLDVDQVELAHSESDDTAIARALGVLDGQAITSIDVDPADGRTRFAFDLGGVLETRPAPAGSYTHEPVEQWMLYQPTGEVLTIRGDGRYSTERGGEGCSDWTAVPS